MLSRSVRKKAHKPQAMSIAVLLLVLVVMPISNALADNYDLNVSIAKVAGKTYGEWAAKWWQWAFDTEFVQFGNGEVDCSAGQRGNVWFLAGSITAGPASRTCLHSIPQGKILFFPLVNYGFWNPDGSCPAPDFNCTVAQKRENANGFFSDQIPGNLFGNTPSYACQLNATVDGVPVQSIGYPIVRTQSPVFPLTYPDGPVLQANDPETIDDGYYVAIPPLEKGEHTIKFTGGLCYFDQSPQDIADGGSPIFLVDVTYRLTVGPPTP
jgi:hypothetical protein